MSAPSLEIWPEHLTPHDLVTYSRCPYEMELLHVQRQSRLAGTPTVARTPLDVVPERHSPLFSPGTARVRVSEGRLDLGVQDLLVYRDEGEEDLPFLFPPERTQLDDRLHRHGMNLIDDELGLSGRPDFIVRRPNGALVPIEYKATHLFVGYHEAHGRIFDVIQAVAECRLVEAMTGHRPPMGIVLYGDAVGQGAREGWVEVPYGDSEDHWIRAALTQIRNDKVRPPVPAERNCSGCEPNRDGHCRYAASRFEGPRPGRN